MTKTVDATNIIPRFGVVDICALVLVCLVVACVVVPLEPRCVVNDRSLLEDEPPFT